MSKQPATFQRPEQAKDFGKDSRIAVKSISLNPTVLSYVTMK